MTCAADAQVEGLRVELLGWTTVRVEALAARAKMASDECVRILKLNRIVIVTKSGELWAIGNLRPNRYATGHVLTGKGDQ